MIEKLRRRFAFTAMLSVCAVLLVILGAVNAASYASTTRGADEVLSYLAENGGAFPRPEPEPEGEQTHPLPRTDIGRRFSAETPYDTRFFFALVEDGSVTMVNTGSIAAVSTKEALSMALAVSESGRERGYSGDYRYLSTDTDGGSIIIFMDNSRQLSAFRQLLRASALISAAGIAAVYVLARLLSRRAVGPVAESYEKQKRFITDAGHELKTPLTVISANTEVLELTGGENEWTKSIKNQVARLTELTGELVSLSRMDEEGGAPPMEEVDLSALVSECAESFAAPAERRGRSIQAEVQPGICRYGSREQLRKLCGILIDNAVRHSSRGAIAVELARTSKGAVLTVKNQAEGIARGPHPEYFERFYRADAARGKDTGGYGLGLSIAQAIAQQHRAKITALSQDGESLTLSVLF